MIILSAALDLVPATTPKGIVAFFNILPALIVSTKDGKLLMEGQSMLAAHLNRPNPIPKTHRLLHRHQLQRHHRESRDSNTHQ